MTNTGEPRETPAERRERLEQRDFDMLKHISTLNVATLVLLLALVRDFFSSAAIQADPLKSTRISLLLFSGSLLLAITGLFFHVAQGRDATMPVRILTVVAYAAFFFGLLAAIYFVYATR